VSFVLFVFFFKGLPIGSGVTTKGTRGHKEIGLPAARDLLSSMGVTNPALRIAAEICIFSALLALAWLEPKQGGSQ
jgi:hypothetical protein